MIPPQADGEFVAALENVRETYETPDDPAFPVLCLDEQPVQLLKETRVPIPASRTPARRVDDESERAGPASIFLFTEPLDGWRHVRVREQRTKVDWAIELEELLRTRAAAAEKVILVCDNLNTHTRGAFYEAFPAEQARALVRRIEFRYTPKHGRWRNIAENELSSRTRQGLNGRRIGDIETLRDETTAWEVVSNDKPRGADWQFQIDDARVKLNTLYPKSLA